MRTIFIINPVAGNGNAVKKWKKFRNSLIFPYEEAITQYQGHAIELVRACRESKEPVLFIGFGGDGTLREIIAGAAGAEQLIVGSIAAGSGNDFGRGFYSFEDAESIRNFLDGPEWRREDLGEFSNGSVYRFVSSSGVGFDAEITDAVNRSILKKWLNKIGFGKVAYLLYVIWTLVNFKPFRLSVDADGEQQIYNDVWLVTISNQPYFGGGMKISPHSKTDDGKLEMTIVHNISRLKVLLVFGTVFTGTHTRFREVVQKSGTAFTLKTDKAICRHVDGDYAGETPAGETIVYSVSENHWNSAKKVKKEDAK